MLNPDHVILILPYLHSLSSFVLLEIYLTLCISLQLRINSRTPDGNNESPVGSERESGSKARVGYWGWGLFASLYAFWYQLVIYGTGTGDVFFDHALGCNATTTLFVGFHFLVADKFGSGRRYASASASTPGGGPDEGEGETGWGYRVRTAYALRMAPRHGLWRAKIRKSGPPSRTSRVRFLTKMGFHLLGNFFLLDILNTIAFAIAFFHPTSSRGPRPTRLQELPLSLMHGGMIYAGLNVMYDAYCILSVGVEATKPEEWPPLFGDVRKAWTVQRAWSLVWHQLMRNHISSASTHVLQAFPRRFLMNQRVKRFTLVALAFVLSGMLHLAGEYHCLHSLHAHTTHEHPASLPHPSSLRLSGVMTTFLLQPLALGLEQLLSHVTRHHPALFSTRWRAVMRGLGYVWVVAWFSFSMSFYTRSMMGAGFMTSWANIPRGWTVGAARFLLRNIQRRAAR